jgi:hypothetical protein
LSVWLLRKKSVQSQQYAARMGLAEFTLITLVPFILGLAVAPFDSQGAILQYYPFRLGDVMLPLSTCLLFACALEQTFTARARQGLLLVCLLLLSWTCSTQAVTFQQQLLALQQFPSEVQGVNPQWKDLCIWVRDRTPKNAIVISSPVEFENFTWLAERPTIAKFKLLPQTKAGILNWYERLTDLSGGMDILAAGDRHKDRRKHIRRELTKGYNQLTTAQVEELIVKYRANYFVTRTGHQLNLPIAYRNSLYILYSAPHSNLN